MNAMLLLASAALAGALSVDNLAAGFSLGIDGVENGSRVRAAAVVAGLTVMAPLAGLAIGSAVAPLVDGIGRLLGGGVLLAVGGQGVLKRERPRSHHAVTMRGVLAIGVAVNLDSLLSGVAIGVSSLPVPVSVLLIAVVPATLTLAALEIGAHLRRRLQFRGGRIGGAVLVAVAVGMMTGVVR